LKPLQVLQGIAGGVLGPRAFNGGLTTALLGLSLHLVIAFGAAAVFCRTSRNLRFLVQHAILSGVLYGVAAYFFMQESVVPLSAARQHPFSLQMQLVGALIHIFSVGLPISLNARHYGGWVGLQRVLIDGTD